MIFQTEKAIKDLGDKIEEKEKSDAEEAIKDLKKALESDNVEDIKSKCSKLQEKTYALAAKVYQQQAPQQEAGKDEPKTDDVKEAQYEEK